ncbi:MAG: hypothetical protein OIF57_17470 [Marinobacterium sp.]|nr:hypothetical protein [Marinobacterium sp.]
MDKDMHSADMTLEQKKEHVFNMIIEVVDYACQSLYRCTISQLREANPTFDDIADMCSDFAGIIESHNKEKFTAADEVIEVMKSAAQAIKSGCDATIIDCAYHLEDFLHRHTR